VTGPNLTPPAFAHAERSILRALIHDRVRPCDRARCGHHGPQREPDRFDPCIPPAPYWKFLEYNNLESRGRLGCPSDLPCIQTPHNASDRAPRPGEPLGRCSHEEPAAGRGRQTPPMCVRAHEPPRPELTDQRRAVAARFRLPPAPITGRLVDLFI
jgi:hypothetical protein